MCTALGDYEMKKMIVCALALVIVCSFVLCSCGESETPKFSEKEKSLMVFLDDFDTALDTSVWNVHDEIRRGGYWDDECAYTKDGMLVLSTVEKDGTYYMGAIDSLGKYENHYGYYEARCYLPKASGIWSAFWLMPQTMKDATTNDVTICGAEIDILESPYYNPNTMPQFENLMPSNMDTYQCAVHVGDYDKVYYKSENFINSRNQYGVDVNIYDGWHTYGVEWTQDYYKFYFDRQVVYEITDKKLISPLDNYLFLSVEIGGSQGVAAKPDFFFANSVDKNPAGTFPIDFLVDYVAAFSEKPF